MKQYEYRIEEFNIPSNKSYDTLLLEFLNKLGQDGWRVVSLDVVPRLAYNESKLKILLEKEQSGT